jgi:hypothetical protein
MSLVRKVINTEYCLDNMEWLSYLFYTVMDNSYQETIVVSCICILSGTTLICFAIKLCTDILVENSRDSYLL